MNLSTIALVLLAWQLLGNGANTKQPSPGPQIGLTDFLNDDTKNMIDCVSKLSSSQSSQEKTSALFQMMMNPAVMNLASNIFGKTQSDSKDSANTTADNSPIHNQATSTTDEHVNGEGYRFETPSANSQEFFRPIDNIADTEVKHKLYWFYDNWYVK